MKLASILYCHNIVCLVNFIVCVNSFNTKVIKNISYDNLLYRDKILLEIFENYKKYERPFGLSDSSNRDSIHLQTKVYVNMHILAISSIDVINMAYNADFYLRQQWYDTRLSWYSDNYFSNYTKSLSITSLLNSIWLPDLFFRNGKEGFMYKMTKPNYLLRLNHQGMILYSQKITMRFSCPMHLSNFPMDHQQCDINIGSYGYTLDDLKFIWNSSPAITIAKNMQISEFDNPIEIRTHDCTGTAKTSTGRYSCLRAVFKLNRQLSSYLVSTYIPAILIVIVSWLSFWINVESVPARVTLGLLTLLGMLTQNKGLSGALPRVSYIKAIDIYIIACILFIICALTEFAIASIYHRKQRYKLWNQWIRNTLNEEIAAFSPNLESSTSRCFKNYFKEERPYIETTNDADCTVLTLQSKYSNPRSCKKPPRHYQPSSPRSGNQAIPMIYQAPELDRLIQSQPTRHHNNLLLDNPVLHERIIKIIESRPDFIESDEIFDCQLDSYSRFLFPAFFLLYNCFYWFYYLILSSNHFDN